MRPFIHPIPIACLLLATYGVVTANWPMVAVALIAGIAALGFVSIRSGERSRSSDIADLLSPDARMLLRPVKKQCEDIRSVSKDRLIQRRGVVSKDTLSRVEDRIRVLLGL